MSKEDYIKLLKDENRHLEGLNSNLKLQIKYKDKDISSLKNTIYASQSDLRMATDRIEQLENENSKVTSELKEVLSIVDVERVKKFVSQYEEPSFEVKG